MKTVLFAPGFQEDITYRDYASVLATIKDRGYNVIFVPIAWKRTTITDWMKQLDDEYAKHDPAQTILAGFSFGAMTAFASAVRRCPSELWLFSLSAFFSDDISTMKKSWLTEIGHRRADAFRQLHFKTLAKGITCPTLLFVGEVEVIKHPSTGQRAQLAHAAIPGSRLIMVKGSHHDVADPNYVAAIRDAIRAS